MQDSNTRPLILKTRAEQVIEHEHGQTVDEILRSLYIDEGLTQQQVADRLRTPRKNVVAWMVKYGIPTRDRRALAATA